MSASDNRIKKLERKLTNLEDKVRILQQTVGIINLNLTNNSLENSKRNQTTTNTKKNSNVFTASVDKKGRFQIETRSRLSNKTRNRGQNNKKNKATVRNTVTKRRMGRFVVENN